MFVHQEIVSLLDVGIERRQRQKEKERERERDKIGIREASERASERAKINPVCGLNGLPRRPHRVQL